MAKKPGPGQCVHCLRYVDRRNWDHVFPRSWYPDSTPSNQEQWKIPSCKQCNDDYGRDEKDMLVRLALCLDPKSAASSGIAKRALRSLDPVSAKGEKDKRMREGHRRKIQAEMIPANSVSRNTLYPGFHGTAGDSMDEQWAIRLPVENVHRLAEKIVRGIVYLKKARYIEAPYQIHAYAVTDENAAQTIELLERFGSRYARAPGIQVDMAVAPEDDVSALFRIVVWGQWTIYASVTHPEVEAFYMALDGERI